MRHLLSVVLSLILAPLTYVATGLAAVKLGNATATTSVDWAAAGIGIVAALVAGGLYAVLVMARLSPFGPVLAGLIFLGVSIWYVLDSDGFVAAMPAKFLGQPGVLWAPVGAGTLMLAVPLLFTIFSPRRWRSNVDPDGAAPVYPTTEVSAAPSYGEQTQTTFTPPVYTPTASAAPTYPDPEPPTAFQQ